MSKHIPQISTTKSRQIFISQELQKNLEAYAAYLCAESGFEYQASDVLSHSLLDEKRLAELQPKIASTASKATYRLPARAWSNLNAAVEQTGMKIEAVIEEITAGIFKEKNFVSFKHRIAQEQQVSAGENAAEPRKKVRKNEALLASPSKAPATVQE